jgi:hypothetical protein
MKNGIKITPAGEVEVIDFSKPDELSVLQGAVEGWVQAIDLSSILSLWVNEEGKMIRLEHNPLAQIFWDMAFGQETDYIVGTVVLTGTPDADGETQGLSDEHVQELKQFLEAAAESILETVK